MRAPLKKMPEPVREIELVSFRMQAIMGVATILIAVFYGAWGVSLSKEQVKIAKEQSNAAMRIDKFNELLSKDSTLIALYTQQIDSFAELNRTLITQTKAMSELLRISQYNERKEKKINQQNIAQGEFAILAKQEEVRKIVFSIEIMPKTIDNIDVIIDSIQYLKSIFDDESKNNDFVKNNDTLLGRFRQIVFESNRLKNNYTVYKSINKDLQSHLSYLKRACDQILSLIWFVEDEIGEVMVGKYYKTNKKR